MRAALYHAHHRQYTEDLPFWIELGRRYGDPILELGCGSGRVLLPLAREGHRAVGLDKDAEMLAVLRRESAGKGAAVLQGDMSRFCLGARFGLILLPCNTYSTLSPEGRRMTLHCVKKHLAHGGRFGVSLPNPAALFELEEQSEVQEEGHFPHPQTGNPVQVSSSWQRAPGKVIVRWHYDHLWPDGQVERLTMETAHWLASAEDYRREIEAEGLRVMESYGDFEGRSYTPDSPYLILVAGD